VTSPRIYLDYNATAPLRSVAREAMLGVVDRPTNASSVHEEGRRAKRIIEAARADVGRLVGTMAGNIVFTSGATEANATALTPDYLRDGKPIRATHLLVSSVEHLSALKSPRFSPDVTRAIPVDSDGVIDLEALEKLIADVTGQGGIPLVSCQLANNETGVIQPVAEVAARVRAVGGLLHCDAVQAVGRIPVDIFALDVDTLSLSAHKIGGLQGVGALVLAPRKSHPLPLITGGGQEGWRRAGTEPVAAIAAFGAAARAALDEGPGWLDVAQRRDRLEVAISAVSNDVAIFARDRARLPNTICLAIAGLVAETAVIAFDLAGVALSSGSACSSGKVTASHVLQAMGVAPDLLRGGLRISLGIGTTDDEIDRFAAIWRRVIAQVRRVQAV
jgi:cysteine desulfurase